MTQSRNRLLWRSVLLFALILVVALLSGLWQRMPDGVYSATWILIIFLFISGLYLLLLAATISHPNQHPIIRHLRNGKHHIVWVYSFVNINMPFGVHMFKLVTIWVHYRDGSQQHIRIEHKYLDECMKCLKEKLPHTTFGYSVQNEQLYRANPELLERE